jgi:DNA gyrase subunit A
LVAVTEHGYGKRTEIGEFSVQGRGGLGVITIKTSDRNGKVVGARLVHDDDELMLITNLGQIIRMRVDGISIIGRNTQGVRLMTMDEEELVVSLARLIPEDEEEELEGEEGEEGLEGASDSEDAEVGAEGEEE